MTDKILIEAGDVFDGDWNQLADCFGICPDTLEAWCQAENYSYQILRDCPADYIDNTDDLVRLQKHFTANYEKQLAKIDEEYYNLLSGTFSYERTIVMSWFQHKFPKRHLKWVSGMGVCDWMIDGEFLDVPTIEQVKVLNFDNRLDGRTLKVLLPLVNFYRSITDLSNCVLTYPVDIGDCVISPTVDS